MKKFRYVEFTDGYWGSTYKSGYLYIVAPKPQDYVDEFSLKKDVSGYCTTLEKIAQLGWELAFVTPCGCLVEGCGQMIQNAYIFKKEIEE